MAKSGILCCAYDCLKRKKEKPMEKSLEMTVKGERMKKVAQKGSYRVPFIRK